MADEKIITSSVFEQSVTEIMQDIANNLYEFEEYTEEEVANLIDLSEEEVAELTRVINDTTVALNKVYSNKKVEELLTELEVSCNKYADEKIGGLASIHLAYVDTLPTTGENNVIYILKSTTGGNDTLNLYNNGWISIGEFAVRLDNYYDKNQIDTLLNDKANKNEVVSQNDVVSDMSNISSSTVLSTAGLEVELNKKIDKTNITKVLDDTVTDEQVPSAKAVYDGLENINEFKVQVVNETLDLNDIVETGIYFFSQAYTPVNIPTGVNGWLVVMKGNGSHVVKQVWYRQGTVNVNTYNTFERYKGGDTWSEWTRFLTEKDYYKALNTGNTVIPENADLNDYMTAGVYTCTGSTVAKTLANCPHVGSNFKLIVNKNTGNDVTFFGYQMIVGTVGNNPVRDVCVYYRGVGTSNNVYVFSKWKIMSGSTVVDVPNTIVSTNDVFTTTDDILYSVSNGMCTLNFEAKNLSYTTDIDHTWVKATDDILPKSKMGVKFPLVCMPSGKSVVCTIDTNNKSLKVLGTIPSGTTRIYGSASYPVAE